MTTLPHRRNQVGKSLDAAAGSRMSEGWTEFTHSDARWKIVAPGSVCFFRLLFLDEIRRLRVGDGRPHLSILDGLANLAARIFRWASVQGVSHSQLEAGFLFATMEPSSQPQAQPIPPEQ